MAENKVNKPQKEENKKTNKFVSWWLGLSKPIKGVIIGATSLGATSAIVFPSLAAAGVFGKKVTDNTAVTETEWKQAMELIDLSNPSKLGNYTIEGSGNEGQASFVAYINGNKNYLKTFSSQTNDNEEVFEIFPEGATTSQYIYTWEVGGGKNYWTYVNDKDFKTGINVLKDYLFIHFAKDNYSKFTKTNDAYEGVVDVYKEDPTHTVPCNFKISFSDKKVTKYYVTSTIGEQTRVLADATFKNYGSTSLPQGCLEKALPTLINLDYNQQDGIYKSDEFVKAQGDYVFLINYDKNKSQHLDTFTIKKGTQTIHFVVSDCKNEAGTSIDYGTLDDEIGFNEGTDAPIYVYGNFSSGFGDTIHAECTKT